MGKSWLKKDFSELRKEKKEQATKRDELDIMTEKKRVKEIIARRKMHDAELAKLSKTKPKPKEHTYTVKVWAKNDSQPWKFTDVTKGEVEKFSNEVYGESEGYVRLGEMALINLGEVTVITIGKVKE